MNKNGLQKFEKLPKGWKIIILGEVLPILYGKGLTKAKRDNDGPYAVYGSSGQVGNHSKALTEKPTLIIGRKGSVGEVYYSRFPCWPIDTTYYVEEKENIDLHFFEYLLKGLRLSKLDKSTAIPGLSRDDYNNVQVAIAPFNEQKRIVTEIEKQFSRLDEAVANLKRIKANLKRYKASILKNAVEGKLTEEWRKANPDVEPADKLQKKIKEKRNVWIKQAIENGESEPRRIKNKLKKHNFKIPKNWRIPDNWKWVSFLTACQIVVDCHNKTAPYETDGIPLVRTTNIKDGRLLLDKVKYVSPKTYAYWSRRCPPEPGDILFTREAPMGEAAIIPIDTKLCMGQRIMLLRVFSNLLNIQYLLYVILSLPFQNKLAHESVGTGVKHLRVGGVESLVFPLPPFEEQKKIVEFVEEKFSVMNEVETEIEKNLKRADRLRQSILKKAFTGKLVPQINTDKSQANSQKQSA